MSSRYRLTSVPRLVPLAAAVALCFSTTTTASTITINSATTASVAGKCTIVDAVISLNTAAVAPGSNCAAGDGNNDTIVIPPSLGPITFTTPAGNANNALILTKPATISGAVDARGKPLVTITRTVELNNKFRLIQTNSNLALYGITLNNGYSVPYAVTTSKGTSFVGGIGGGIYATGKASTITLSHSTISGNHASYVTNEGGGNGGGIYAANAVIVSNSTISGNTADYGGGGIVSHIGSVTVTGSTISGNTAGQYAGGIYATASGTTVSLTNTTISGNTAYTGGGGVDAYAATLNFCTLSGNSVHSGQPGSGILVKTNSNATATLAYGNSGGNDFDATVSASNLQLSGDYNLIGSMGSKVAIASGSGAHDKNCNPNLAALGDNDGPTLTRALPAGSCAVDAGPTNGGALNYDQRGFPYARKSGSAADIGAFELQPSDIIFYNGFEP